MILLGANMPTSVYGLYRTEFGFTPTIQTLIYGVYVAGLVPALLFFGPLSDALGRRTVLITALALSVVGTLVLAFADATVWLFVGRVAQGIAVGAASAAGSAALVEQEPKFDHRRAALVSTVTGALGGALGPLVSGAIAQYLPQPLRLPYLIFLVAFIPALIVLLLLPQIGKHHTPEAVLPDATCSRRHPRDILAELARRRAVVGRSRALPVGGPVMDDQPAEHRQPSARRRGSRTGDDLLGGRATRRKPHGTRARPSPSVWESSLWGMIGLLVVDLVPSLALLGVITVVVGAGHGLAFAGGMKRVNAAARTHARESHGGVLAAFFTVSYAGLAIPSIIAGIAITIQGMQTAIIELSIIGTLLCLAVMGFNLRGAREPAEARRYP